MSRFDGPRLLLSDIREKGANVVPALIPASHLGVINIIGQVRKTYEGIDELAMSIAAHGQQTRGVLPMHTPEEAHQRLEIFNQVFKTDTRIGDLKHLWLADKPGAKEREYFPIAAAGHRRYLAVNKIEEWIAKDPLFVPGKAYKRGYRADLFFGLAPGQALIMQFNENRHVAVPVIEEVRSAWDFYRVMRVIREGYGESELARDIGRTTDWVRQMLRFCDLPESVQAFVDGDGGMPKISYGRMVEIARLAHGYEEIARHPLGEDTMLRWIRDAIVENLSAERLAERVTAFLKRKEAESAGQGSLFGDPADLQAEPKRHARQIAGKKLIMGLLQFLGYLEEIRRLVNVGVLAPADHPLAPELDEAIRELYSPGSPLKMAVRATERFSALVPQLQRLASDPKLRLSPHEREMVGSMPIVLREVENAGRAVVALEEAGTPSLF